MNRAEVGCYYDEYYLLWQYKKRRSISTLHRQFEELSLNIVQTLQSMAYDILQNRDDIGAKGFAYFLYRKYFLPKRTFDCKLLCSNRIWWMVAFGVSVWLCGSSVRDILMRWMEMPVSISAVPSITPISAIPFPTITICTQTKINPHQSLKLKPEWVHSQMCSAGPHSNLYLNYSEHMNESVYDTMENLAPNLVDVMSNCFWQNRWYSCASIFGRVITEDGVCFTFNALNSNDTYTNE